MFRLVVLFLAVLLLGISGITAAQDSPPPGPPLGRPPLVECVEGETIPCVEIVDEIDDIVGTWRRYIPGNSAVMAYSTFTDDSSVSTASLDPAGATIIYSTIWAFEDGLALIGAPENMGIPAECIEPGIYEARLLRLGEQPVALTFLKIEDPCLGRVSNFIEPFIYYTGTEVTESRSGDVRTRSLIPCPDEEVAEAYPCDVVATAPEDIAGVWRRYVGHPTFAEVGGMGYIRHNSDGSFVLADSLENTLTPNEASLYGTVSFDGPIAILRVDSQVPPECAMAGYYLRVIRFGSQPVALSATPLHDPCVPRRDGDMSEALIWAGAE